MPQIADGKRIDRASRVIKAAPQRIYRALLDPQAIATWRAPKGMTAQIHLFDARPGGRFQMSLHYGSVYHKAADHKAFGKTSADTDVVNGRFVDLVSDQRVVEQVEFVSSDSAFAGTMTITTTLRAIGSDATEVTIECANVPVGIAPEDHQEGLMSTLENLAAYAEGPGGSG